MWKFRFLKDWMCLFKNNHYRDQINKTFCLFPEGGKQNYIDLKDENVC